MFYKYKFMNRPSAKQIRIWVEKISESDREAFDSLFRALYPQLVMFSMRYTQNKAVASDLVQDAFLILWNKRRELELGQSTKAYLYSIVRNSSLNYIRDHSSKTVGLEEAEVEVEVDESRLESIDEMKESEGLINLIRGWIEELPERRCEAFKLSRYEGLDHEEIAEVMDISANTVNNHIVSALEYLRERHNEYRKEANNKL